MRYFIPMGPRNKNGSAGYTLMELLVVLGIIALLVALVAPQVIRYLGDARSGTARAQVKNIESALELYYLDTGTYPGTQVGLMSLVKAPADDLNWKGPYLKQETGLIDPWKKPYIYSNPGKASAYEVMSFGRDGQPGGTGEDADIMSGVK
jgi:general secretion pathway protein G